MFINGTVQIDPASRLAHAKLVREALRLSDVSIEKAALYMAMDRAQFDRQLNGEGHISYTRLMALPQEFWRWFYFLGAGELGLPTCVDRARDAWAALTGRKKAARMTLPAVQDERKRA